ncbi:N-acyl homoserine lactonase family protein [Roseomonas sp. OT10]|uniref:N-acyl homoserine lactonase family protein n=1 Tax=Roseomonas cutis TaxID=2897332 RepID=UPI001E356667|nr:N-acyl homoserine lactonase family protein [Roseomonas sp. OT10]UFN48462.1 N-acyl homoserine lactonase family protein [Roseomonas sp. OT10]
MTEDTYEVLALRYATFAGRRRRDNLLRVDLHADAPYPLDFFIWVLRNAERVIVVDTGFDTREAARRNREVLLEPRDALAAAGIDAATVRDVIVTHMHFDHAGGITQFPNATFHLQDAEMAFATGRYMAHRHVAHPFGVEVTCDMVRAVYAGRVTFHDGEDVIAPNVTVHRVGGHSAGLQVVRVLTRRGWMVLASDAMHLYQNLLEENPFPLICHLGDMYEAFRTLHRLASGPTLIIPGHDPLVTRCFPALQAGTVFRLDASPIRLPSEMLAAPPDIA